MNDYKKWLIDKQRQHESKAADNEEAYQQTGENRYYNAHLKHDYYARALTDAFKSLGDEDQARQASVRLIKAVHNEAVTISKTLPPDEGIKKILLELQNATITGA